jgi:hypothetical protein
VAAVPVPVGVSPVRRREAGIEELERPAAARVAASLGEAPRCSGRCR